MISATLAQLRILIQDLSTQVYYAELGAALEAQHLGSLFNVMDKETGWKLDLIFRKSTPFGLEELRLRRKVELHGLHLFVASPEDIIIAKLAWAKQGGSQRQIEDAGAVLTVSGKALDMVYLEKWVRELELSEQWNAAARGPGLS